MERSRLTPLACSLFVLAGAAALIAGCGGNAESEASGEPRDVAEAAGPVFADRATELGVDFVHFNGMSGEFYTAEVTGAGCGVLDFDGDGDLDLYLVQGRMLGPGKEFEGALYPPPEGAFPLVDRLYRNDLEVLADGTRRLGFTEVTATSGLVSDGYGMGVAAGDYDNDGRTDLYVTNLGPNRLFRNQGEGRFRDVTAEANADDERWSVPAAFLDFDRDGWLDLFVGNYVDFSFDDPKTCFRVTGARDYCGPLAYKEVSDRLFHNQGDGTFRDVTLEAGITAAFGSALGVAVSDFDGDGWPDLYVANDGRPNQLWINQRDGTFVDEALLRGAAVNAEGFAEASMGVEAADFDNDGDDDLFMAHLLGETNTLFENDGGGMYEDVSVNSGLGPPSTWATAFGAAAIDVDNDGRLDVVTVNGEVRVIEEQARKKVPLPLRQPNQLFRNLGGGRFEEVTEQAGEAFQRLEVSRGAAVGDLDDDGDRDVLVLNNNGPAEVLINRVGQERRWLGLRMTSSEAPRDMLGTRVVVFFADGSSLARTVRTDGSFASANDPRVHVGLGGAAEVERVRAHWPSGRVEEWTGVPIGRYTTLQEGTGTPVAERGDG